MRSPHVAPPFESTTPRAERNEYGQPVGRRTPGKRALTDSLAPASLQLAAAYAYPLEDDEAHAVAADGLRGDGAPLPYLERIQASFGRHEVGGVRAHVGGAASDAAGALGAHAYAYGDRVAFGEAPDLRIAAHEAAHVVQQRGGVQLAGGVGREGDPYERHADAVADQVVAGESAEALLDEMAGGGGGPVVQRLTAEERELAQSRVASDLTLEQIAHRIAYLDGDLPVMATADRERPPAQRVRDGEDGNPTEASAVWRAPRAARVDQLDTEGLTALGFDCSRFEFFSGESGLQFWTLPVLPGAERTPIIAFRGTDGWTDRIDDLNTEGIGMAQFTMNQAAIRGALQRLGGRGVVATGHSLGGVLAQVAACFYPDLIVSVVTFQASGISREVFDRVRDLPPEQRVAAHHHRVNGDLLDEAGEGFLPGDVTLWGGPVFDPVAAADAHSTYPVLASRSPHSPEWARGDTDHSVGSIVRAGTTDDPDLGRSLGGATEHMRQHPALTAETIGTVAGLVQPELEALSVVGPALEVARRAGSAYARIWLDLFPHAERGDRTYRELKDDMIVARCREEDIADRIPLMQRNLHELFPEYVATDMAHQSEEAMATAGSFVAAVRRHVPLDGAQEARVRSIYARLTAASRGADATAAGEGAGPRDRSHDAETLARLEALSTEERSAEASPEGGPQAAAEPPASAPSHDEIPFPERAIQPISLDTIPPDLWPPTVRSAPHEYYYETSERRRDGSSWVGRRFLLRDPDRRGRSRPRPDHVAETADQQMIVGDEAYRAQMTTGDVAAQQTGLAAGDMRAYRDALPPGEQRRLAQDDARAALAAGGGDANALPEAERERYRQAMAEMRSASERAGEIAADAFARSRGFGTSDMRFPPGGADSAGSGHFDRVYVRDDQPTKVLIIEAKGGTSQLQTARFQSGMSLPPHQRPATDDPLRHYQQGTLGYLIRTTGRGPSEMRGITVHYRSSDGAHDADVTLNQAIRWALEDTQRYPGGQSLEYWIVAARLDAAGAFEAPLAERFVLPARREGTGSSADE